MPAMTDDGFCALEPVSYTHLDVYKRQELDSEDEAFERPAWVVAEVTSDPRYFNSNLQKNPYSQWKTA